MPLMMAPSDAFQMEEMIALPPEEQEERNISLGGPEATQRLVDMILSFQTRNFHALW
jgi:hypothetical protein